MPKTSRLLSKYIGQILITFCLISFLKLGNAQNTISYEPPYFQTFTMEDGLSSSHITAILLDSKGYLWVGTSNGLNRYNGTQFEHFFKNQTTTNSISGNRIRCIKEDKLGRIWIGTYKNGLSIYDYGTNSFTNYQPNEKDATSLNQWDVASIHFDSADSNTVWIGFGPSDNLKGGLDRFNISSGTFQHFRPSFDSSYVKRNRFNEAVVSFIDDPYDQNVLWLGTAHGLMHFNKATGEFTLYSITTTKKSGKLFHSPVVSICEQAPGMLVLATSSGGIATFDTRLRKLVHQTYFQEKIVNQKNLVADIIKIDEHKYLIGADNLGLAWYIPSVDSVHFFPSDITNTHKALQTTVTDLYKDVYGRIWIGFENGLQVINPKQQHIREYNLPIPDGFETNGEVGGLIELDSTLLVGQFRGFGVYEINKNTKQVKDKSEVLDNKSNLHIVDLIQSHDELILASSEQGFLNITTNPITPHKVSIENKATGEEYELFYTYTALLEDHNNNIWMCTAYHGLVFWNRKDNTITKFNNESTPSFDVSKNGIMMEMVQDGQQNIWIGGAAGPIVINPNNNNFIEPKIDSSLLPNDINKEVFCLESDASGNVWIGTIGNGLLKYDVKKQTIIRPAGPNIIGTSDIMGLRTDRKNRLWVLLEGTMYMHDIALNKWKKIGEDYGLRKDFGYAQSMICLENGEMIIGGNAVDLLTFFPDSLLKTETPPAARIEGFKIFNEFPSGIVQTNLPDIIELSPHQDYFSFTYSGFGALLSNDVQYRYKLSGLDNNWVNVGSRQYAGFTNIPSGTYQFELQASYDGEQWGAPAKIQLHIATPFYATWWFILISMAAIASILFLLFKWRLNQLKEKEDIQRAFEKQLALEEIHTLRLQMNPHFIFNCLNSIRYFIQSEHNDKAEEQITAFAKLLRKILHHSKQQFISLKEELDALNLYVSLEKERFDNTFEFQISIDKSIEPEQTAVQPLILQPFVENAIKHGIMHSDRPGKIHIHIQLNASNRIRITLEDNGVGRTAAAKFNTESSLTHRKSYGLEITQNRLNALQVITGNEVKFAVEDLLDESNNALGTRIIIEHQLMSFPIGANTI